VAQEERRSGRWRWSPRAGWKKESGPWKTRAERREKRSWATGEVLARERNEGEARAGRAEKKKKRGLLALSFSSLLFFFFLTLKLFKQFYLNSNKFEFKPYTPNTNKTMLQHECTNKLIL
jgi:hypothetical protein